MSKTKRQIIIALQGTAGVGKTAVARKLCRKLPGKTARISVDVIRDMSCLNATTLRESDEYVTMAKRASFSLIKAYLKEGCNVLIEIAPPTDADEDKGITDKWLVKKLKNLGARVFLLHASLSEVIKRNKRRRGEFGQGNLSNKLIEQIYKLYEKYIDKNDYEVIDTKKIGADKTTLIILEKVIKKRQ